MAETIVYVLIAAAGAAVFAFGWFSINTEEDDL